MSLQNPLVVWITHEVDHFSGVLFQVEKLLRIFASTESNIIVAIAAHHPAVVFPFHSIAGMEIVFADQKLQRRGGRFTQRERLDTDPPATQL